MMKKLTALVMLAILLSGCGENMGVLGQPTDESSVSESSDNASGSSASVLNREENFELKCSTVCEQLRTNNADFFTTKFDKSSVQYQSGEIYLSKILNITAIDLQSGEKTGKSSAAAFMNIYSESEDDIFKAVTNFLSFVEENLSKISENNDFSAYFFINDNEHFDINITFRENKYAITFSDKNVRAAYSEMFKAVKKFEDSSQGLTFNGLIKYNAVTEQYAPFDISCDYEGKTLSHKWYKVEAPGGFFFVTYIDDGSYDDMSDEELIYYAYKASRDPANYTENTTRNTYYFAHKSGYDLACAITFSLGDNASKDNSCSWYGDYKRLSANPLYLELLSGLLVTEE